MAMHNHASRCESSSSDNQSCLGPVGADVRGGLWGAASYGVADWMALSAYGNAKAVRVGVRPGSKGTATVLPATHLRSERHFSTVPEVAPAPVSR